MKKKILLIDMDHVIADISSQYIKYYKELTGIETNASDLIGKPEDEAFPAPGLIKRFLNTPGFFRTALVIPDSQQVIEELNGLFELYIVSAAMEFPQSLIEKYEWLNEYFPFIHWSQIIFCGYKKCIAGDYMIDDHIKNLNNFKGEKILFTAPHNVNINVQGYRRANSWLEVKHLLIGQNALAL